jgi:hypothetical protein
MQQKPGNRSVPHDATSKVDELSAARGIAIGSVCGGILWVLIGFALQVVIPRSV